MSSNPVRPLSDEALVCAVLEGETPRFAELVVRHDPAVRRVVARGIRNPDAREELVQETWCLAFRNLSSLVTPRSVRAWVLRIARRCLVAHHRRAASRTLQALESDPAAPGAGVAGQWVWEEVGMLQVPFAEVLTLHYREGRTYAEIARRLRLSASTVRGRIYEARRALRERLERKDATR